MNDFAHAVQFIRENRDYYKKRLPLVMALAAIGWIELAVLAVMMEG